MMRRSGGIGQHTLVGAYVMDAVPDSDRAGFERHMLGCEQCREDARGLREAAARLAQAAAVTPRPELRDETLRAAAGIRQLPPVVPGETGDDAARRLRLAVRRLVRPAGPRPWLARMAMATVVVLAVTATVLGLHLTSMQSRLTAAQRRDNAIAAVVGARDATTMTARVSTGGMATVVMSRRERSLVFVARGLARLPASQAYELWLMSPAGPRPAGMLAPGQHGMSGPVVLGHLAAGDQLGLTVEPAAGAARPTSAPIVLVALDR